MRIVIASVVYKNALGYLEDFLRSISKQTYQKFSVLLLNDDMPYEYLGNILSKIEFKKNQDVLIIKSYKESSISQLRIQMILEAKIRGFDFLILSDSDDMLSPNRVECYLSALNPQYSFYYNDLIDFNGQMIMPVLPAETISWKQIEEENFLGLSNTGIWLKNFSLQFINSLTTGDTKIFDWYLYSRILLAGMSGKKVENCYTYYRIHDNNIAGNMLLSEEQIKKEIIVKIEHYRLLEKEEPYFKHLRRIYERINKGEEEYILNKEDMFWWGIIKQK